MLTKGIFIFRLDEDIKSLQVKQEESKVTSHCC